MIPAELDRLLNVGWFIFPCSRTSKAAAFKGAAEAASNDRAQVAEWLRRYPAANWRIALGVSGLMALDIDRPGATHEADGFKSMAALVAKHGELPKRPTGRSGGSGGLAMLFAHHGEPLMGKSGAIGAGIDPLRGKQGLMVAPSIHPVSRGLYRWVIGPDEIPPPRLPGWLAALLAPPPPPPPPAYKLTSQRAINAVMRAVLAVRDAPPGQANDTLNRKSYVLGCWVGAGLLGAAEAADALAHAAAQRGMPASEARATIRSGLKAGERNPVQSNAQ